MVVEDLHHPPRHQRHRHVRRVAEGDDPDATVRVIDPIDGTYEYLNGCDSYSVCLGVVENGKISMAIVYFPARDMLYFIGTDGQSYFVENFSQFIEAKTQRDSLERYCSEHCPVTIPLKHP